MTSMVKILYKYPISRKKTNKADKINPIPILKIIKQPTGYTRHKNFAVNGNPSAKTKTKNMISVRAKLINEEMFFDNKKMYLGTFTLLKIPALAISEFIPLFVDSVKYETSKLPQNK
jgi:hypothetical protein